MATHNQVPAQTNVCAARTRVGGYKRGKNKGGRLGMSKVRTREGGYEQWQAQMTVGMNKGWRALHEREPPTRVGKLECE